MSIEEREDNELGELPRSLMDERREALDYTMEGSRVDGFFAKSMFDQRNYGPPPDIRQESNVRNRPGEIGSVPRGFDVTSTFDARPVNGRDFLETFTLSYFFEEEETEAQIASSTFIVPDGYVGILKGFRYYVNNILNIGTNELSVTIINDSVNLNNYDLMELQQINNNFVPVYGVSNPLKEIGIRISHPAPVVYVGRDETVTINIELYGNLLLSRGIPSQYEPANLI